MKLKNNTPANQSVMCTKVKGDPDYINVVGESTLEIDDALWASQKHNFKSQLEAGTLEVVEAPETTAAEKAEKTAQKLAEAQELVAASQGVVAPVVRKT